MDIASVMGLERAGAARGEVAGRPSGEDGSTGREPAGGFDAVYERAQDQTAGDAPNNGESEARAEQRPEARPQRKAERAAERTEIDAIMTELSRAVDAAGSAQPAARARTDRDARSRIIRWRPACCPSAGP